MAFSEFGLIWRYGFVAISDNSNSNCVAFTQQLRIITLIVNT